jgi:hypothetical protein
MQCLLLLYESMLVLNIQDFMSSQSPYQHTMFIKSYYDYLQSGIKKTV